MRPEDLHVKHTHVAPTLLVWGPHLEPLSWQSVLWVLYPFARSKACQYFFSYTELTYSTCWSSEIRFLSAWITVQVPFLVLVPWRFLLLPFCLGKLWLCSLCLQFGGSNLSCDLLLIRKRCWFSVCSAFNLLLGRVQLPSSSLHANWKPSELPQLCRIHF